MTLRVYLEPTFTGTDEGDGGIRRVVEAQRKHLPSYGIEFVDNLEQADVIHTHIGPNKPTHRYLLANNVPWVNSIHGAYWSEYEWYEWAHQANSLLMEAVREADAITAPSRWVADAIERASLRPAQPIGHGVDLDEWAGGKVKHRGYALWNKSRPDPVCDPDDVAQLAYRAPKIPFVSTFWPPDAPALPNVEVVGRVPYEASKNLVMHAGVYLATTRETFGIGTIEAMAAGVPVLGWRWGGQAEIIEHRETGWLSQPGDYEDLLAGLQYCLENRERLGRNARKVVRDRYQWADVVKAYADLYERVLTEWRAAREGPRVSVIVPAYNLAGYLPAALDSVKAQTSGDWECVIVDDASPDDTGKVAAAYAKEDQRFRVVTNKTNEYLAGSLNVGMAAAKGRFVLPLDADNMLAPNTLEVLAGELERDRAIDIAYGSVRFVEEDGATPSRYDGFGDDPGHSGWPMSFRATWQIEGRNMIPSTALYRRRVWSLTGGYRRRYRTAEDADFWTRATSYGFRARMVTEADTLIYRNREGSMSRVEAKPQYESWYPWSWSEDALPPAAFDRGPGERLSIPSCEPVLVSVVIPVGPGHEKYLIDAVDSVDAQSMRLWECIVVNDTGLPKSALPLLPAWVRVIGNDSEKPVGPARARNIGIAAARGRTFVPLDADDTLEPTALSNMWGAYVRFSGYVYGDHFEMREGKDLEVWKTPEYDAWLLVPSTKEAKGCIHAVTGLYAVADWQEVGGFDEELAAWEDWDFQLRLADKGICGTRIPVPIFTYRKDTGMRREENYANFETGKEAMTARWADVFEGRRELAGCGSCGKGGGGRVTPPAGQAYQASAGGVPPPEQLSDYMVVEFVGERLGVRTYRAPSSRQYLFDASESHRQKYVQKDDAEWFRALADFRVRSPDAPEAAKA